MLFSRRSALSVISCSTAVALCNHARAETYPARPVKVLVGFPAGGGADTLTRSITDWLQARLGQPFVIENRPGAGTNLATEAVVRSPADGYTLLATTTSNLLNGALYDNLTYDFARDIAPVASLSTQPLVLCVAPTLPVHSLPELIAYAKAHPRAVNAGNTGTGTVSHLAAEALRLATGLVFTDVPYRGSSPMLTDLLAGHIHMAFDIIPGSIQHIRSGGLRALAVTSAERSNTLPDVPAVAEFVSDYDVFAVAGIAAPRGTPVDRIEKLNHEINQGLNDPKLRARLIDLGVTVKTGSPADFAALITRETTKWTNVIRSSGVKIR